MKKIAFYVEGQTEQFFINKLLIEIAGYKNIEIELEQFQGYKKGKNKSIYSRTSSQPVDPKHYALIVDCMGDQSVKSRMIEEYQSLLAQDYTEIIGLLDLFPRSNLAKFEDELIHGTVKRNRQVTPPLPFNTSIIVAVNEVEAWFLSECTHFAYIDKSLTNSFIISKVGFDPCTDDMTLRFHPAQDLHDIYQLANKAYMDCKGNKTRNRVERTVECLDYVNIYIKLTNKITKLKELISKIDTFLT